MYGLITVIQLETNRTPIPGVKTVAQVEQNAAALGWELSAADVVELGKLGV